MKMFALMLTTTVVLAQTAAQTTFEVASAARSEATGGQAQKTKDRSVGICLDAQAVDGGL